MKKQFLAYQGEEFTIEWYYNNRGNSSALEYYQERLPIEKSSILKAIKFLYLNRHLIDFYVSSLRVRELSLPMRTENSHQRYLQGKKSGP
jgi:hypothetical protein